MEVRMARHLGMCFGVRDAIDLALSLTETKPLTILGDLVHNPDVVAQMDRAGARRVRQQEEITTEAVLLTAHGTSDRVKWQLRQAGHEIHDATCPLVTRVHLAVVKLVGEGRHPVVIGQANHVEVRGLVGDLDLYTIVENEDDLAQLAGRPRLGVVAQTTQPLERVELLVAAMRTRFPEADIRFIDTVCQPTKDRQDAMRDLVESCEVIVVVGGPESNNSRKLTELARRLGRRAYQVSGVSELQPEWFENVECVGLTAGTSTPDAVIDDVRQWLAGL
jgi:4-hydroxy-3-methylbut-2-enyl diphosphate reductase